jgi:hypothetical protein
MGCDYNSTNLSAQRVSASDPDAEQRRQWFEEFEAAARRPLRQRFRYAFIKTYRPVLDDADFRSFESMSEYLAWCEQNLPSWLGYGQTV